jgi:peptidoglycan-associated lipoprotein
MLRVTVLQNVLANPNDPNSPITGTTALPEAIVQVLGLDPESNISKRLVANNKGIIEMPIERAIDYRITASQASYFTKTEQATTKGKDKLKQNDTVWVQVNMLLEKIYQKKEIVLQNIYYDLDKADIRDDAKPTLNQLARLLKENPNIRIELGSHTDSRGSDKYNLTLSQQRAQSAVNYLVSQGIEAGRMAARGYGETQLTNRCANGVDCTEEEHQQNRRTTFKVIGENYQSN